MARNTRNEIIESIVISIRIRLARNFAAFPFPKQMDESQAVDLVELVDAGLRKFDQFQRYDICQISTEDAVLLQEQRLISPAKSEAKRS